MLAEFFDDLAVRDAIKKHFIQLITDLFWQAGDIAGSAGMGVLSFKFRV